MPNSDSGRNASPQITTAKAERSRRPAGGYFSAVTNFARQVYSHSDGLAGGLTICMIVAVLSLYGLLDSLDRTIFDGMSRARTVSGQVAKVLLLTVPANESPSSAEWELLCQRLVEAKVQRVMVVMPLATTTIDELNTLPCAKSLVLGLPLPGDGRTLDATLAAIDHLRGLAFPYGLISIGDQGEQIRRRWTAYDLHGMSHPALEVMVGNISLPVQRQQYFPNLKLSPEFLPEISLARVLREGLVSDLVSGRVVLLGYADNPFLQSVNVPGFSQPVSLLRYQGMLIDAQLNHAQLIVASTGQRLLGMLLAALIMCLLLQPLSLRSGLLFLGASLALESFLALLLLTLMAVWLPLAELFIAQIGVFFAVYRAKAGREANYLRAMLGLTGSKVQMRMLPANILQSDEHWSLIIRLIDQTLNLKRTIFLERLPGEHRLKEIIALRCSLSDIDEKRRDYERTPYTTAIAACSVIEIERYLIGGEGGERQFLVPLASAGEVMGFWAFSIDERYLHRGEDFKRSVNEIADQVADLLYQRNVWKSRQETSEHAWGRVFEDSNIGTYRQLSHCISLLEQRLSSLESVFALQSNAAVLYDLFGRVILLNSRMTELMAGEGIAPNKLTATDFVAQISRRPIEEVRQLIRGLIMNRQTISFSVMLKGQPNQRYLLEAKALNSDERGDAETQETRPFSLRGVLVELVDISEASRVSELKTDLVSQVGYKLANDLESLLLAIHLLQADDLPGEQRRLVADMAQGTVEDASAIVRRIRALLDTEITANAQGGRPFPIDPVTILERVLNDRYQYLEQLKLDFNFTVPHFQTLVMALPVELEEIFSTVIKLVADDARTGSTLMLKISDDAEFVRFGFSNEGFGTHAENLARSATGKPREAVLASPGIELIRRTLESWGGKLEASSAVGQGTLITLQFATFCSHC